MRNRHASSQQCWMLLSLLPALAVGLAPVVIALAQQPAPHEDPLTLSGEAGRSGGRLVVSLRAEPKTLNPVLATDAPSREVIATMRADLFHINLATQLTEAALPKSVKVSSDGLQYTLTLLQGLRFSHGQPLDAYAVLFSFRVYLHESVHLPHRDLLLVV